VRKLATYPEAVAAGRTRSGNLTDSAASPQYRGRFNSYWTRGIRTHGPHPPARRTEL